MSKKKYTNEKIGKIKIIKDFLPKPKELVIREETMKVTLSLSKESVNYFKEEAKKYHAHYQTMIRTLLDKYAQHYERSNERKDV
jgi:hypothetical protein